MSAKARRSASSCAFSGRQPKRCVQPSAGGGRWKRKSPAGADGVRPRHSADLGEIRFRGAISPTNRTGRTAIHAPEPAMREALRTGRSERWACMPGKAEPAKSASSVCPERKARTEPGYAAAAGVPACARARVTAAMAATASQIHALLFRFPVISGEASYQASSHIVP